MNGTCLQNIQAYAIFGLKLIVPTIFVISPFLTLHWLYPKCPFRMWIPVAVSFVAHAILLNECYLRLSKNNKNLQKTIDELSTDYDHLLRQRSLVLFPIKEEFVYINIDEKSVG